MTQDEMKKKVAEAALEYVKSGSIVGVGTGSTANMFIDALATRKDDILGTVASSEATAERLRGHGIPVLDLNEALSKVDSLSVYVDGADEFDAGKNLTKGGGGALTRYFHSVELSNGARRELETKASIVNKVSTGDMGIAFVKGSLLIDFARLKV